VPAGRGAAFLRSLSLLPCSLSLLPRSLSLLRSLSLPPLSLFLPLQKRVHLVDQHDVGVRQLPRGLVDGAGGPPRRELRHQPRGVDDGDDAAERRRRLEGLVRPEGRGRRPRVREAAGLDEDAVEGAAAAAASRSGGARWGRGGRGSGDGGGGAPAPPRLLFRLFRRLFLLLPGGFRQQPLERGQEAGLGRAAQAAVGELDPVLEGHGGARATARLSHAFSSPQTPRHCRGCGAGAQQVGLQAPLGSKLVQYHGEPEAVPGVQQVAHERRLAGAEEARDERDGDRGRTRQRRRRRRGARARRLRRSIGNARILLALFLLFFSVFLFLSRGRLLRNVDRELWQGHRLGRELVAVAFAHICVS
jgi:hypothetical protein